MPVTVELPKEKWNGKVREITLGATPAQGGTRTSTVTVGGETTLPFLHFEGSIPHRPALAVEMQDVPPQDWSTTLLEAWDTAASDPVSWAKKAVELGADALAVKLRGTHPERQNRSAAEAAETVKAILGAVGVPLIVYGPEVAEKDNEVLVAVAEAAAGERLALGNCEDKNYRTIVAGALAHGHLVVAKTPIDVNLAKQLNILISDMGLPLDRVLMDPTTGALGYGIEYTYSVMERLRLAALMGDSMTQQPMICTVGEESWRQKESKVKDGVPSLWGDFAGRGPLWEMATAMALLQSGADILVLRHPKTIKTMRETIDKLMSS
ncbi:MAG: acetyl-CoA decarbonylase/synthase complex subunit delta [Chloroflexi bacterium]|nr:acetyl-CoA decarbonylase/synthase complex subunit delta [Chloroflexota bacterium]